MDADIKILEDKITQLVSLCGSLHEENVQLQGDLTKAQKDSDTLKSNMEQASIKLEGLLDKIPQSEEAA
jgi:cell division protein ZapB